jgi:acyl carrier protein
LIKIWKEIFNNKKINLNDNFFDNGGNSLLAISLVNKINTVFKIDIRLREIFEKPALCNIAKTIESCLSLKK